MSPTSTLSRRLRAAALLAPAALALACGAASAKTLVFCSEGSPENFYAAVNTTGTSFDATTQVYNNLVEFERGATKVVPGLAESWTISPDGLEYTFKLRKGVKWHNTSQELQADARLQRRRRHLHDGAAVEGGRPVLQGHEHEPLLLQRHGHAQAAEVRSTASTTTR